MSYDNASWHYGGDFPKDLPDEAGGTHIGMFVAWALLAGLGGEMYTEFPEDIRELESRSVTPGEFIFEACDGKFIEENLNDDGNAFAEAYYSSNLFFDDYAGLFTTSPSIYHVADTWDNFDRLKPLLDERLARWRATP
jgi:hypothetical protein